MLTRNSQLFCYLRKESDELCQQKLKKLVISEELKRNVEMICKFAYVEYSFTNGYIINLKNELIWFDKLKINDTI